MESSGKSQGFYGMAPDAPDPALKRSALRTSLAVAGVLCIATLLVANRLHLGPGFAAKVAAAFVIGLALARPLLRAHVPHAAFGAANGVTLARMAMAALLAGLLGEGATPALAATVLLIGIPALALDGVDGWLARRSRMASEFGARFDMETDAALLLILCTLAWQFDKAGAWILAAGLMRYGFVAAAWVWPPLRRPLPPSIRRKSVCVVQIIALFVVIAPFVPRGASVAVAAASLALLAWSFAVDVRWLARQRA
jgi:phosphatidylglycerophosphate synthase